MEDYIQLDILNMWIGITGVTSAYLAMMVVKKLSEMEEELLSLEKEEELKFAQLQQA